MVLTCTRTSLSGCEWRHLECCLGQIYLDDTFSTAKDPNQKGLEVAYVDGGPSYNNTTSLVVH